MDNRKYTSPENARHSTGPKSEEGKRRSSQNARKHGVYAQALILPGENQTAFDALLAHHLHTFRPEGPIEESLVRQMTGTLWRLERLAPAETTIVSIQMQRMQLLFDAEFTEQTTAGKFALAFAELTTRHEGFAHVSREERRLLRHYDQLKRTLADLQQQRPPALPPNADDRPESDPPQTEETKAQAANATEIDETKLNPPTATVVTDPWAGIYRSLPLPEIKTPASRQTASHAAAEPN